MTDNATAYRTVYLLLHDRKFLKDHAQIDPKVFPPGPLRFLTDLALRLWDQHHTTLTSGALDQALDAEERSLRRAKTTADAVVRAFFELDKYRPEKKSMPYVREVCGEWLAQYVLGAHVEQAGKALDRGDVEGARESLNAGLVPVVQERDGLRLVDYVGKPLPKPTAGAVPTGLYELDKLWDGGIRPGELGLLLGPTNVGKSMIAVFFAAQAFWRGASVLYYTFELTTSQVMERVISGILEIGPKTLRRRIGEDSPGDVWEESLIRTAKRRGLKTRPKADIDVRTGTMTIRNLLHDLDDYKREHGHAPGLLILDSADDLAADQQKRARWEELRDIFTTLRSEVAQRRRIPIWTTGQTTREAVDKAKLSLRHVGDAFAKAQRAHYVLGLAQGEKERDAEDGPHMNVYILKDTLHGTRGGWLRCFTAFGRGGDGFAGLETLATYGLPVTIGRESDPE